MRKILLAGGLLLGFAGGAAAQQPVVTAPYPVTSTAASSTIAVTNTFQSLFDGFTIQAAGARRSGCLIANNGASSMFVFLGAGTPTTPTSIPLAAGATFNCNMGGVVVQDRVRITGTAGQAFFAVQQ
jgi:hypothetical protein